VVIVSGGLVYHYTIAPVRTEPTRLSKFNTLCQVLLMWAVLTALAGLVLPQIIIQSLIWVVTFTVLATMFQYMVIWGLRARAVVRSRHGQ